MIDQVKLKIRRTFKKEGAISNTTKPKEKVFSSGTNLRTNFL